MVDSSEAFRELVRTNQGCVVVAAGSDSDESHIQRVIDALARYRIPYEVRICSAHKQPEDVMKMIEEYNALGGSLAYVAIAGGTDALSGILSYHAMGPVISCPPDSPNDSCTRNPKGSSNAYIEKPINTARFIAQMYAGLNPTYREAVQERRERKIAQLHTADRKFRQSKTRTNYERHGSQH